jgi:hypothetical protein
MGNDANTLNSIKLVSGILNYTYPVCFQNFSHGSKGEPSPMWRLLKLNAPEWKALSLGFFGCVAIGAIMPMFAIFYGEMFDVSYIEVREYSSVVAYIYSIAAVKVGMAALYRLEGPGIKSWWGRDFPQQPRPALGLT